MNVGRIILDNQIEDVLEILQLVRSSGAFRTDREFPQCQPVAGRC
jgi:hypothetical protein